MRVKTIQRELDHRHPGVSGGHLCRGTYGVAEIAGRKHGGEAAIGAQPRRGIAHPLLDPQHMRQSWIGGCDAGGCGQSRLAQELLGVGQRHRPACHAGERPQLSTANHHTVGRSA